MSNRVYIYPNGVIVDGFIHYSRVDELRHGKHADTSTSRRFRYYSPKKIQRHVMEDLNEMLDSLYGAVLAPGWRCWYEMSGIDDAPAGLQGLSACFLPVSEDDACGAHDKMAM
jgi:hypothetical protein